jgi:hypothetical protein
MELELDVLVVARKLVKDVVHLWRRKFEKHKTSSSYRLPKHQKTTLLYSKAQKRRVTIAWNG